MHVESTQVPQHSADLVQPNASLWNLIKALVDDQQSGHKHADTPSVV